MSERMNIPLGGVSNEPNDYGTEEGALSLSLNAVKHHGSIRPVMPGSPVEDIGELPANTDVVAIHEVGDMKHYILLEEIVPEDESAGARPEAGLPIRITVHYLCLKGKVQIWWTSSYGDYFAGAILHLYIGAGEKWDWLQVPYDSVYEVEMANIAVSATLKEDGTVSEHTLYEFPDNTLEGNEDCLHVLMIGQADGTAIGYDRISATKLVHYAKTDINVTALCYQDKIRLGYKSEGYTTIYQMNVRLGAGSRTQEVTLKANEVFEFTGVDKLSIGSKENGNDIMYWTGTEEPVVPSPSPEGGGGTTTPPDGGGDDTGGGDDGGNTGNGGNTTPSEDNEDIEGEVEILSKPRLSVDVDVEWTDDRTIKVLGTVPAGTEKTDPTVMRLTRIMAVKEGEVAVWYQDAPDKTLMEIYVATCTEADLREGRILPLLHKKLPVKSDGLRFTYKPSVDCIVFWFDDMDNWELKRPTTANVITPELWPYEIEIKSYNLDNYQVVAVVPRGSDQVDADAYRYPYVIPEVQEGDIITWTFDEPRTSNATAYILYGTIDDVTVGFLSPLRYCVGQATDDTNTVYQATADNTGPLIWRFDYATVTITRPVATASTFMMSRAASAAILTEEMVYVIDVIGTPMDPNNIFRDENGTLNEDFEINVHVDQAESQEEDIDTGSDTFFPTGQARYRMLYLDAKATEKKHVWITDIASDVLSVTPTGNVLTVAAKGKPLSYIIWKDEEYHVLGSEVDAPRVYPYLFSKTVGLADLYSLFGASFTNDAANTNLMQNESASTTVWTPLAKNEAKYITFNAEHQKFVSDKAFALVNSAHRILMQKGYFYAPFFVRFAFRMFDGSHILHTAPQLMIAGAAGKPLLAVDITSPSEDEGTKVKNADLSPLFVASRLFAEVSPIGTTWNGLITHLDVFVSPPLINYSDDTAAIKAVGITKSTAQADQINAPADIMPAFDGRYMKNRKLMGNIFDEDEDQTSPSSYIRMRRSTWKIHHVYNRFDDPEDPIFLIDTIAYPAIEVREYFSGAPSTKLPLDYADDDLVIGKTKDEKNIYLKDTGLTNLSSYKYFKWNDIGPYRVFFEGPYETFQMIRLWCVGPGEKTAPKYSLELQRTDSKSYITDIKDNNLFRLVQSIPMERLSGGWKGDLNIEEHTLTGTDNAETLPDQGQMRSRVTTDIAPFAYNNRLSMAASTWDLPDTSAIADFCVQNEPEDYKGYYIEKAWIKALVNGQVAYKRLEIGTDSGRYTYAENIRYFYYPCYEATHLILQVLHEQATDGKPHKVMEFSMDKHKLLNGAYLFNNFDSISPTKTYSYAKREEMLEDETLKIAMSGSPTITYGNMVRVSGVGNPFYFNEVNQVTLPSGKISGLSTTAKALSQGQFGAFPLYCFSDNGIWALEVSDTGTYSAKQPVSRAVCTNPESITQTEGQVLFVTKRGLMALDGSSVTCVSEILSGHNYTSALSKLDKVKELAGLQDVPNPDTHIEEWLQDARLLYDDKRQMIYAFNGEDVLGYVYSISDQAWGMMVHDLDHPLPCYTDALAVTREDGEGKRKLVNMSDHTRCGAAPKSVLVTRPLTFGSADAYKSIEALTLRGMLNNDDAKLVIWASNDLKHWAVAASSQTSWYRGKSGTPYKYYRIGIVLDWEEEDSLNAIGADITTRLTNRIR